jgi:hypothetical protein
MLEKETLQKLKLALPRGIQAKVSRKLGISSSSISDALNGRLNGGNYFQIIEHLVTEVNNQKNEQAQKAKKLTEAIENFQN